MNLKKIAIAINAITFPLLGFATDYTDITGSKTFNNGDTAQTISTSPADIINITAGGIVVQNNSNGSSSYRGVVDLDGGSVNFGIGSKIIATDIAGAYATNALALGNPSNTTQFEAKNLTLQANNNSSVASISGLSIYEGDNNVTLRGNTLITVNSQNNTFSSGGFFASGASVSGISSDGSSKIVADNLKIDVTSDIASDNNSASGISINSFGSSQNKLTYNNAEININSKQSSVGAIGLLNRDGVIEGKNTKISIIGGTKGTMDQDLYGISLLSQSNTAKVLLDGNTDISIKSGDDDIWMTGITTDGNSEFIQSSGNISINFDTNGYADNVVYGMRASDESNTNKTNIELRLNNLTINSLGNADDGAYINATRNGVINIDANSISLGANTMKSGEIALLADEGGRIKLNSSNSTHIVGDLVADQGTIDFNVANGVFIGQALTFNGGQINTPRGIDTFLDQTMTNTSGKINMGLSNNMVWQMTGNSDINQLKMTDSIINFASQITPGNFSKLSIADLKDGSNAKFNMGLDIASGQGDLLEITNTATGSYALNISNQGNSATTGTESIAIIQDNSANQAATFTANITDLGGYQYGLVQNGRNWQLTATGGLTNAAGASANFLNSNYLLTYIDTQTLLQRMGELRNTDAKGGDFWIRGFGGKLNSFSSNKLHGFDMSYSGVQLGIDKLISGNRGNFYIGAMVGYTDADPNYKQGSGGVRDVNGGIYGTYVDTSGFYIDGIAKYTRIKNNFSANDSVGQKVTGKAKTDGYGLSLEAGKRFKLNTSNFYLEPQVQLSYSHQGGDTVKASNGLKVKLDSYDSLLGRASLIAGYQVKQGENPVDIYLKSGYVREFKGNTAYRLNGSKEKHDFKGGWVDSAVGVTAQFNKRHNVYVEVSYANGSRFDKQQANLGYRYQF